MRWLLVLLCVSELVWAAPRAELRDGGFWQPPEVIVDGKAYDVYSYELMDAMRSNRQAWQYLKRVQIYDTLQWAFWTGGLAAALTYDLTVSNSNFKFGTSLLILAAGMVPAGILQWRMRVNRDRAIDAYNGNDSTAMVITPQIAPVYNGATAGLGISF